jgi:hypothetical protein
MSGSTIKALQSARERPRKNSLSTEAHANQQELPGRQESLENKKSPQPPERPEYNKGILAAGEILKNTFHNLVVSCVSRLRDLRLSDNRSSVEIIRIHTGFQTLLAQPNARSQ